MISAIIITKNEENNIASCLESIKWVDEIIVVDSGSTDRTEEICRQYTKNFYFNEWAGFGKQKQHAYDMASNVWIFSIDADEIVTEDLKCEILEKISSDNTSDGFYLPRLSYYLNKPIRHSGWYPDFNLRIVKKDKGFFSQDLVHERLCINGSFEFLDNPLLHFPFNSISSQIQKLDHYSSLSARDMQSKGKRISWSMLFLKTIYSFFRVYFLKMGFLDGWRGFLIAKNSSIFTFYKYLKLKELYLTGKLD